MRQSARCSTSSKAAMSAPQARMQPQHSSTWPAAQPGPVLFRQQPLETAWRLAAAVSAGRSMTTMQGSTAGLEAAGARPAGRQRCASPAAAAGRRWGPEAAPQHRPCWAAALWRAAPRRCGRQLAHRLWGSGQAAPRRQKAHCRRVRPPRARLGRRLTPAPPCCPLCRLHHEAQHRIPVYGLPEEAGD